MNYSQLAGKTSKAPNVVALPVDSYWYGEAIKTIKNSARFGDGTEVRERLLLQITLITNYVMNYSQLGGKASKATNIVSLPVDSYCSSEAIKNN